jgi:hypothetical protein
MAVQVQGQNGVPIYGDSGSNAERVVLYDSAGNPISQLPGAVVGATQKVLPVGGVSEGNYDQIRLDRMGNMRPGFDNLWLRETIEGNSINTSVWAPTNATFTAAQSASTGILLNSAASAAGGVYYTLTSNKQFPLFQQAPLRARFKARVLPQSNNVFEVGFGQPSGAGAQINNGACWRYTTGGAVVPVLQFNGGDVAQGADCSGLLSSANYYTFEVLLTDQEVIFTIYSAGLIINTQTLTYPNGQPNAWAVSHLPVFVRLYSVFTPTAAAQAYLSNVMVESFDLSTNRPWQQQLAGTGLGGEVSPTAFSSTSNFLNSTAPTTQTLSNTTPCYTSLGGMFSFAAVAGAATDYGIFSFQVPAPYSFYMTGVHITAYNTGAAVASTATLLQWSAYGQSTGASLTAGGLRFTLGSQYFPVGAAIGQCADKDLDIPFEVPIRTDNAKYCGIGLRMPVGTATASQVIQGSVLIRGYFE